MNRTGSLRSWTSKDSIESSTDMKIRKFVKTTLQDWEGKNSCMILLSDPNAPCSDDDIELDEILSYIKENRDFLETVVVSDSEPTEDPGLFELLKKLKSLKIKVKVDTNGTNPETLDDLIGAKLIDKVCLIILAPLDSVEYDKVALKNIDVESVKKTIEILYASDIKYEFKITIVPGVINHDSFFRILKSLSERDSLIIQQFDPAASPDPRYNTMKPYPVPVLVRMANTAKEHVKHVRIRGT
jgi:Pyruvate-formate lyase-activating enzyme